MLLADFDISLAASGAIWLLFFLVVFKSLRNKGRGDATAIANAAAEANAAANGGNADVGGIAIHIHTGVMNGSIPDSTLPSGEYVLPANDPAVAELLGKLLSPALPIAEQNAFAPLPKVGEYETVSFS